MSTGSCRSTQRGDDQTRYYAERYVDQTAQTPAGSLRHRHRRYIWRSALCVTALAVFVGCSQDATSTDPTDPVVIDPTDTVVIDPTDTVVIGPSDTTDTIVQEPAGGDGVAESVVDGLQSGDTDAVGGPFDAGVGDQPGPLKYKADTYGAGVVDLGMHYLPDRDRYDLDEFRDEVAVRVDSVLVRDGAVRGLVQNMSEGLFARSVTVSTGGGRWVVPLTVQPTEVVPFAIEGYAGSADPAMIEFEVTAELAPTPDPMRSFYITDNPGPIYLPWDELQYLFPDFALGSPLEGTAADQPVRYYETVVVLWAPTSHPSIAERVTDQRIDDLRVYLTKMDDDGRVTDIRELVPYLYMQTGLADDGGEIWGWPRVDRLPFVDPYRPDQPGRGSQGFVVGFKPGPVGTAQFVLTVGGVHQDTS